MPPHIIRPSEWLKRCTVLVTKVPLRKKKILSVSSEITKVKKYLIIVRDAMHHAAPDRLQVHTSQSKGTELFVFHLKDDERNHNSHTQNAVQRRLACQL